MLNNEKFAFNDIVYDVISKMSKLGEEQFKAFLTERLVTCKVPVSDPILLNSLNLPSNPIKATEKDPVLTLAMMEKLMKAGETRSELVENLLHTEIFEVPQSLSVNQYSLYHGTKSHITSQFRTISKPSFHLTKSGKVVELSMLLLKKRVSWVKSFEDYARFLYHVILKSAEPYSRFDIVTDRYFSESLKEGIRDNRGSDGLIFSFNDSTVFPANFETDFLTNITNKTNLNGYLAQKFIKLHDNDKQTICITYNDLVISNDNNVLNENLITVSTSEEADSRIIQHAINIGFNDYKEVSIQTVDLGVVVLSLGYANIVKDAGVEKFSVVYGSKEKYFDVFDNLSYFGEDICTALSYFHALTGCDTTSSFYQLGKAKFWKTWMKQHNNNNESLTRTFIHLGDQPANIDPNDIDIIAKYIYNCYGLDTSSGTSFEALRLHQLLNTPNTCLRTLGPSVSAIEQHVRCACIQAWYLWKLSQLELDIPDPTSWGWKRSSVSTFSYIALWQACSLPDVHSLLKTCSCTKGSCDNCYCKKSGMNCMTFCKCEESKCKNSDLF